MSYEKEKVGNMINYTVPWHRLSCTTDNAISDNFNSAEFLKKSKFAGHPAGIWSLKDNDMTQILNKTWLEYISDTLMPVDSCLMCYRQAQFVYPQAHTDLYQTEKPTIFGINLAVNSNDDSQMVWYDVPNETGTLAVTPADTKYLHWPVTEIEHKELDRLTIGNQLTLVRTGIAHNVIVNQQDRWSISLRFKAIPDISSWPAVVDYFSKYLVTS